MKKKMSFLLKTVISFVMLIAITGFPGFTQGNDNPSITKTFTLDVPGTLEVVTSGGKIKVEGHGGNIVEVQAFVRKKGNLLSSSDPVLAELLKDPGFRIEKNGSAVTAVTRDIDNQKLWNNVSVSFYVFVPHQMSCNLKTSGGGVDVSKVEGTQVVKTSGGRITTSEVTGDLDAHTSGGGIHVTKQDGNMQLHTSGGGITVKEARGNIIGQTSGGHITLENISGNVDVHTSGGGINIDGYAESVQASTSGGRIDAKIDGLSEMLLLKSSGGGISAVIPSGLGLDLDLKASKVNVDLDNFSGDAEKGKITGPMNGGGIPVEIKTSGGNIDLIFR